MRSAEYGLRNAECGICSSFGHAFSICRWQFSLLYYFIQQFFLISASDKFQKHGQMMSIFRTPHSPLRIPHSALRIPHSAFRIPHSAFRTPHSALRIHLRYLSSHPKNTRCHSKLFCGLLTQCPSSGKLKKREGIPFNCAT